MKKLILFKLLFIVLSANAQTTLSPVFKKTEKEYLFAMSALKSNKFIVNNYNTNDFGIKIDLKLKTKYKERSDVKAGGLAVMLAGVAFTTASILESGDVKIYQGETARQIMLGTGIVLTITGAGISMNNK